MTLENTPFVIKQGDTAYSLKRELVDENGLAIDLTGATVTFAMMSAKTKVVKVPRSTASIVGAPTLGVAQYDWQTGDTNTAGDFLGDFKVTLAGGVIKTIPNRGYVPISVTPMIV